MFARSPNAHDGPANEVCTPVSTSTQHTNDTIVGENFTQPEESGPTPMSGEQGSGPSKKICRPTCGIGLEKLTKAKGKKLAINVSPSKGRPTNPIEFDKLSSEMGLMVRNNLPMNTKFKDITEGITEESLSRIEGDPIEGCKSTHQKKRTNEWVQPENESAHRSFHLARKAFAIELEAFRSKNEEIQSIIQVQEKRTKFLRLIQGITNLGTKRVENNC